MDTIDINLLPGKRHKRRVSKEEKQLVIITVAVLFLLSAMYLGILYVKNQKISKINSLDAQITALKGVQEVLNTRETLGNKVLYYETSIKNFTLKQVNWNELLKEIAQSIPKDTTLNSISADRASLLITIDGKTKNLQTLAWTMYALKNNSNFSQVTLKEYTVPYGNKQTTNNKESFTTFTITFKWKGLKR